LEIDANFNGFGVMVTMIQERDGFHENECRRHQLGAM
jgi:hypothetical protein